MRRARRGATLIELVVVLAIIGVVAGAVVPALPSPTPAPIEVASNAVLRALRTTRDEALRRGMPSRLTIDLTSGRVWYSDETRGVALDLPSGCLLRTPTDRLVVVSAADGGSSAYRITVQCGRDRREITIDPLAGDPRVVEGP
ncbi:MAG: type II secretion system GspH family protein [Gemmatimonadaceae bacterium]|nr:type II secretion system GspH family protein [Gemmatimonadaceae bacterium]